MPRKRIAVGRIGRALLLLAVAAATALAGAGVARADGDPASDVLYTGRVFFPYSTTVSRSAQQALLGTVDAATKAGYPIRVALIADPVDLGAVTVLWKKPRKYATFLSFELSFIYKGPVLIVMPSGVGLARYKHGTSAEYAAISKLPVAGGRDGLAVTAVDAVKALAAHAGHPIAGAGSSSTSSSSASRVLAGGIALAVLLVSGGGIILTRRLRATRRQG